MFWTYELFGIDIYHIVCWFWVYSILGWLVESIYMSICFRKITNRGIIRGPICPIYGFGALFVYFALRPLEGHYVLLYIIGAILATCVEFVVAKLMIRYIGFVWWDYSDKPLNYKGILCLESTLAWGLYTIVMFGFLHKAVISFTNRISVGTGRMLIALLGIYYVIAFVRAIWGAKDMEETPGIKRVKLQEKQS
ncbi:MAG: putative ABC transporter permease [Lachnospiraceae bacterium]|nr:putative ABC transporter permease [Lachnospiraceae bacterium]